MAVDLNHHTYGEVLSNAGLTLGFKDTSSSLPAQGSSSSSTSADGTTTTDSTDSGGSLPSILGGSLPSILIGTVDIGAIGNAIGGSVSLIGPSNPKPLTQAQVYAQLYGYRDDFLDDSASTSGAVVGTEDWTTLWVESQKLGYTPVFTDPQTGTEYSYAYVSGLLGLNLEDTASNLTTTQYLTQQLEAPWHSINNALFGQDILLFDTVTIPLREVESALNNVVDSISSSLAGAITGALGSYGPPTSGAQSALADLSQVLTGAH